jgi:hypothetical protein
MSLEPKRAIPQNLGRLMSPDDQKRFGFKTLEALNAEQEAKQEKDLHGMFMAFLHRESFGYYHAAMNKKSPFLIGQPDFGVYRGSRIVWIEFKVGTNKLSPEQKTQIATLLADDNTVHVCYSYPEAVNAVRAFFGIKK